MKNRAFIICMMALAAAMPIAAKDGKVSARIGVEAALENDFTMFGIGPWGDVSASFGNLDLEAYLGWTPYLEPQSVGTLYGEVDAYYHILLKNRASVHPALSVSDFIRLEPFASTVMVEPSVKFDVRNVFIKVCVPLRVSPDFEPFLYLEPGLHLENLTLKIRGAASIDPFQLTYIRWWADYAFGKNDLYAYGIAGITESGMADEYLISYSQYLGFYIGL